MINKLRDKARELLENKTVDMVIGFEEGTAGIVRPALISDPAKADKLIYDERCVHNLALYLTKKEIKRIKKVAIVSSIYVMKSISVLASENQVNDDKILVLGFNEQGDSSANKELIEFANLDAVEKYIISYQQDTIKPKDKLLLEKIDSMNFEERLEYWKNELSKCFKCYACRAACPMCYCGTCTVSCNQPQWITVPANELGNLEWHLMRAMHLAGRCINCGQCADACPLDIPINILTLKVSEDIAKNFNYKAGSGVKQDYVLSTYKPNDKENFIV